VGEKGRREEERQRTSGHTCSCSHDSFGKKPTNKLRFLRLNI